MRSLFLAPLLLLAGGEALACTYPLPTRAKEESDAAYNARINPWIENWAAEKSRNWQTAMFDNSDRVSLARITGSTGRVDPPGKAGMDAPPPVWESVAVPFAGLKGFLKSNPVSLRYVLKMQCAIFEQGSAAVAPVGTLVVLYEHDGIGDVVIAEGITADKANDPRILAALAKLPVDQSRPMP